MRISCNVLLFVHVDRRLNSSSLLCDCQLSWLTQWLRNNGFESTVSASCGFPESLVGTSILEVKPEQLECGNQIVVFCVFLLPTICV